MSKDNTGIRQIDNSEKGPTDVAFKKDGGGKIVTKNYTLPSRYQVNDWVDLNFGECGSIKTCKVIKVHFTESKVLYDVELAEPCTRLYNIDSCFVDPGKNPYTK